jgi:hypothetical protein
MTNPTVDLNLQPDRNAILDWLIFWFKDCRRGLMEIAWTDPSGGGPRHGKHFPLHEIKRAAECLLGKSRWRSPQSLLISLGSDAPERGNERLSWCASLIPRPPMSLVTGFLYGR